MNHRIGVKETSRRSLGNGRVVTRQSAKIFAIRIFCAMHGAALSSAFSLGDAPGRGLFMRRLILRNSLSPGDIVMLTAAVRDLHLSYPGQFLTDTRTPC